MLSSCGIRDQLTFHPDTESEILESNFPAYVREVRLTTEDDETIQSFLFKHSDDQDRPFVIYFHGNAGNVYHRFDYGITLYNMDFDVLLVSYRGYAKSSGQPDEDGIYLDGETAINYVTDSLGIKELNLTIIGRSLGTTVAVENAIGKNFNAVILVTPLTSGKEMATAMGMGSLKSVAGNSYNSLEKISELKSPLLIIHGDQDELVPYSMGKQLYDEYSGTKELITITNGGHNDLHRVDSLKYWGGIERFVLKS